MKLAFVVVIALGATFSSQAHAQDSSQIQRFAYGNDAAAWSVLSAARADCDAQVGQSIRTVVAYLKCNNSAWTTYYRAVSFPWMDIVFKNQAEQLAIAEAADAGQMSTDRLQLEMAASDERFIQERNQRVELARRAPVAQPSVPTYAQPIAPTQSVSRTSDQCRAAAYANAPSSRTGSFGEYLANVQRAYQACMSGTPLPAEPRSFTTTCNPNGLGPGAGVTCTTR